MSQVAQINHRPRTATPNLTVARARTRLLVADSDPSTAAALIALPAANCDVVAVSDGAQAYRLLRQDNGFDAIVLNPNVSGISGLDLLRYMKSENRLRRIVVIVAVSDGQTKSVREAFVAGAIACLFKPFAGDLLLRTVTMVLPVQPAKRKAA